MMPLQTGKNPRPVTVMKTIQPVTIREADQDQQKEVALTPPALEGPLTEADIVVTEVTLTVITLTTAVVQDTDPSVHQAQTLTLQPQRDIPLGESTLHLITAGVDQGVEAARGEVGAEAEEGQVVAVEVAAKGEAVV